METRRIGKLEVSVIGLGCNNFGWRIDESASRLVIDAAIDSGITFFDTADIYGGTKSEQIIGRALKGRRDQVILATKFGKEVSPGKTGARPEYIHQACNDSLERLGTDYIDLYQLHAPDPTVPIAETLGALNDLVIAGKVREIGCSNFNGALLSDASSASETLGAARFASVQNHYNLLMRDDEYDAIPECERLNVAYLPYFPLESGLLTGKFRRGQEAPEGSRIANGGWTAKLYTDRTLEIIEGLHEYAESKSQTLLTLAISWLLRLRVISSVIAGATTAVQVRANAASGGWPLRPRDIESIDEILQSK